MFNFTKKHSNALVEANEQIAEVGAKYNAAMKKIEYLESELNQSYEVQHTMSEGVKKCITSLYTVQHQLQAVVMYLEYSNKHILELTQENKVLKSAGDEWLKRSLKLGFDVLTAKDKLKKAENERDSAVKMCEHLQAELKNYRNSDHG
ncbi:MAG: hypothetical protein QX199_14305 [Methylococcaceae bacterium]